VFELEWSTYRYYTTLIAMTRLIKRLLLKELHMSPSALIGRTEFAYLSSVRTSFSDENQSKIWKSCAFFLDSQICNGVKNSLLKNIPAAIIHFLSKR
jgi:hypothetical protein